MLQETELLYSRLLEARAARSGRSHPLEGKRGTHLSEGAGAPEGAGATAVAGAPAGAGAPHVIPVHRTGGPAA